MKLRIPDGIIKLSGVILEKDVDNQDVETGKIEILYDKADSKFSYYSEVLVADPNDTIGWGADGHFYIIQEIPYTQIEEDNSFVTSFKTLVYMKIAPGTLEFN